MKFDNWFCKYYNYRSIDNNLLSLPYPAEDCNCGIFSNIFDNYDINVKHSLLFNSLIGKYESQMSRNWHDWNYIGENSKNKKQSTKKVLLYILHIQYMLMKIQIQKY